MRGYIQIYADDNNNHFMTSRRDNGANAYMRILCDYFLRRSEVSVTVLPTYQQLCICQIRVP